jgi:serine/threonine protein kinase
MYNKSREKPIIKSRKVRKFRYSDNIDMNLIELFSKLKLKNCRRDRYNYKIISNVGSGGFGKTYLAIDTTTNKKIVVKEISININLYSIRQYFTLFENELKHLSYFTTIIPEYICPLICIDFYKQTGYEPPKLVIVMEYCGEDMNTLLYNIIRGKIQKPSLSTILLWFHNLATALEEIHNNNILHLDIKPENILLRENGNIALIDFGLSHSIEDYNQYRAKIGTLKYMAPEILDINNLRDYFSQYELNNFRYDGKVDIYSLGRTLNSFVEIYPDLIPLVKKMIEINPKKRLSATEVRDEILNMLISKEYKLDKNDQSSFLKNLGLYGSALIKVTTKQIGNILYKKPIYSTPSGRPIKSVVK